MKSGDRDILLSSNYFAWTWKRWRSERMVTEQTPKWTFDQERVIYSQLDLGNPSVFFSFKNNSIFTYIHQQIKWEQNTGIDTKYKNYLYEGRSQKSIGWENTKVKLFWFPFQEQKAKRGHVPSLSCNFILHSFFSRFCLQMICNFVSIFFYMSH